VSKIPSTKRSLEKLGLSTIAERLSQIEKLTKSASPDFSKEHQILDQFIELVGSLSKLNPEQVIEENLRTPKIVYDGSRGLVHHPPKNLAGLSKKVAVRAELRKSFSDFAKDFLAHRAEDLTGSERNKLNIAAQKLIYLASFIDQHYKIPEKVVVEEQAEEFKKKLKTGPFAREAQKINRLISIIYEMSGDIWNRKHEYLAEDLAKRVERKQETLRDPEKITLEKLLSEKDTPKQKDLLKSVQEGLGEIYTGSPISYGEYINALFKIGDFSVREYTSANLIKFNKSKPNNLEDFLEDMKLEAIDSFVSEHPEVSSEKALEAIEEVLSTEIKIRVSEDDSYSDLIRLGVGPFNFLKRDIFLSNEDSSEENSSEPIKIDIGLETPPSRQKKEQPKKKQKKTKQKKDVEKHTIPRMPKNYLVSQDFENDTQSIRELKPVLRYWNYYLSELEGAFKNLLSRIRKFLEEEKMSAQESKDKTEPSKEDYSRILDQQILNQLENIKGGLK